MIFTYVIGFIFLAHTYVLSNCYVHSTVPASLEIIGRSLPSHWEVLVDRGRLRDVTSAGTHRDAVGVLKREKPSWAGLLESHRRCTVASQPGRGR